MSDIKDFKLPDLGEGLTEGTIVEWQVAVGDVIELNQVVASIETAKAVVDVPSPYAGTVVETIGEEGQELEVGSVFVRIDPTGSPSAATGAAAAGAAAGSTAGGPKSTGLDADEEPQPLVGYGSKGGEGSRRRRRGGAAAGNGADPSPASPARPLAKPPVRKLAKDLGVDLAAVAPGSGPGGVITRADVQAAAGGGSAGATAADRPTGEVSFLDGPEPGLPATQASEVSPPPTLYVPSGAGEKPVPGFRGKSPGQVEPITGIRKRIIAKMEQSRREIPEATCSFEADVTDLWAMRERLTDQARADGFDVKITPFAVVLRAVVLGLRRFPTLNARIDQDRGEILHLESINLGFAADTDRGLVVPNVKDAQSKSLLQIAWELNALAAAARDGSVTPGQLTGGTFTVSNYGAFGNVDGNPIINHPEAAILGVGAMLERPWVVDGELAVRRVCKLSLAFDHRISDGGEAGRFVTYVGQLLETPASILLHS